MLRMLAAAFTLALAACSEPSGPPFEPRTDVKGIMVSIVDPAADVLWDSVGTVISEEGIDEWYPESDEEWAAVKNAAVVIMEAGNLLMIGERARDNELWMQMSRGMIDAGAEALAAAETRNPDEVFAVGETVYRACDQCHGHYWIDDADRGRIRETPRTRGEGQTEP